MQNMMLIVASYTQLVLLSSMTSKAVRTTLSLPADLLEAADKMVREGKARSRNEFMAMALRRELAAQRRAEIDAAFAEMANDEEYKAEALRMAEEFADSDWEAFQIREAGYHQRNEAAS